MIWNKGLRIADLAGKGARGINVPLHSTLKPLIEPQATPASSVPTSAIARMVPRVSNA